MAAIVNYIDLVPLAEIKQYLRIDAANVDFDAELTAMCNSACSLIERHTQLVLKPKQKDFIFGCDKMIRVYIAPINSVISPIDFDTANVSQMSLYSVYYDKQGYYENDTILTLDIGYANTDDVDPLVKSAALETIRIWFYAAESDIGKGALPYMAMDMISPLRRFVF